MARLYINDLYYDFRLKYSCCDIINNLFEVIYALLILPTIYSLSKLIYQSHIKVIISIKNILHILFIVLGAFEFNQFF